MPRRSFLARVLAIGAAACGGGDDSGAAPPDGGADGASVDGTSSGDADATSSVETGSESGSKDAGDGGDAGDAGKGDAGAVVFPLAVSSNGRYLVDHAGNPFPILGDATWSAPHNLVDADQQTYLADRVGRGFDAVLTEAIEHKFTLKKPPLDVAGNLPFSTRLDAQPWTGSPDGTTTTCGSGSWSGSTSDQFPADPYADPSTQTPDFTYPVAAYWTRVDAFVSACASRGVAVFLFPAYVGYGGRDEGWMGEMVSNDTVLGYGGFGQQPWSNAQLSKLWNYGAWLAQHYASAPNIVWVLGGDYGTGGSGSFSAAQSAAVASLLAGMKSVPGQASTLWTAHWGRPSLGSDLSSFASSLDLESVYSDVAAALHARAGYAHAPAQPAFELEDYYENNATGGEPDRRFAWWSFLGGIAGQFFGNEFLWPFDDAHGGWQANLDSEGARDMAVLNGFVRSVAWQDLVPSGLAGEKSIVTANGSSEANADYVGCAASPLGKLGVCYVPPAWALGSFTVDSTVMSAPYRARWLNPTSGATTDIAMGIANTGTYAFMPPGDNGSGHSDWVLVMDAP